MNVIFFSDGSLQMEYKMKDEYVKNNFITNIYIAAFATSSARVRLYEMLDILGDKAMYYDKYCLY